MPSLAYFSLHTPAPHRLALMRADFDSRPTRYPHCPEAMKPRTWRDVRAYGLHSYAAAFGLASRGSNDGRPALYSFDDASMPVRSIRFADEVLDGIRHRGWFADEGGHGDCGVVRGIVAALPHGRFLSGYHWTDNGEFVLFLDQVFSDSEECARDADGEAGRYAETLREDDARYRAMQNAEGSAKKNSPPFALHGRTIARRGAHIS